MNILKAYYYLFYKLYKFWDYISVPKFWSDFKAGVSIIALEIWLLLSCINYYFVLNNIKKQINIFDSFVLFPFMFILIINYILFIHYDEMWKKYRVEFDNLPKSKNIIGGIIVWIIIAFIIYNFFISVNCLHKIRSY